MDDKIAVYLAKATESLTTAESEFVNGRYNARTAAITPVFRLRSRRSFRKGSGHAGIGDTISFRGSLLACSSIEESDSEWNCGRLLLKLRICATRPTTSQRMFRESKPSALLADRGNLFPRSIRERLLGTTEEPGIEISPAIQAAIDELKGLIAARFPDAKFVVRERCDPPGISLIATVDIEDTDEVFSVVVDRLVDIQVEEGVPVFVVPLQPIERVIAEMRRQADAHTCYRLTG